MAANDQVKMDAICRMESHTKIYCVKFEGYSRIQHLAGKHIEIGTFDLAGFCWAIILCPSGIWSTYHGRNTYPEYICIYLNLLSKFNTVIDVQLEFSLIDPNGCSSPVAAKGTYITEGESFGFSEFMKKDALEASEYLKDDCFTVKCKLTIIRPFCLDAMRKKVIVPSV